MLVTLFLVIFFMLPGGYIRGPQQLGEKGVPVAYPGMSGSGWTLGSGPGRCSRKAGSSGALGKRGALSITCPRTPPPTACPQMQGLRGHPSRLSRLTVEDAVDEG